MLQDSDKRIIGSVLGALVKLHAPEAADVLAERLKDPDFVVRSAAAEGLGTLKPPNGPAALREAYTAAQSDSAYVRAWRNPAGPGRVRSREATATSRRR